MIEIVNLNKIRKHKKHVDKTSKAAQNRVKFGRTKAEKITAKHEEQLKSKALDGKKITYLKTD